MQKLTTEGELTRIDSFIIRLRRVLAVGPDEEIDEKVTLVEQGVDSLMAVEVRSWFIKELDVDIPVLKILGGTSISDLVEEALKLLPTSILDVEKLEAGSIPQVQVTKPIPVPQTQASTNPPSSTTGSDDESPSKTPASTRSGIDTPMTPADVKPAHDPSNLFKKLVEGEKKDRSPSVTHIPDEILSPQSYGQAGFWFLNDYLDNKTAFNMAAMLKLSGPIRLKSLEAAVKVIGDRHEILRTRFCWSGEGDERTPNQGISPHSSMKLTTKRIHSELEAEKEMQELHKVVWDLESGNGAVKISLLSLSDQAHFILLGLHHIYLDGYSFSVFFKDLETAYIANKLAPLSQESQYRSFAAQQKQLYQSGALQETIDHYRQTFPEQFNPIELFPFAESGTRQAALRYSAHEVKLTIASELAAKIRQLARKNRSTSFHVYLAALQALLFRLLPNTDDLFIGIADANRGDKKFMGSIGFFLNLLPLRFHRSKRGTRLGSIIQTARNIAYGALQHSQLPFDVLLRELNVPRSDKHTPIFQVFLDYRQVVQERASWGGCKLEGESWCNSGTGYDVALEVTENINTDTRLSLRLQDNLYSLENTQLLLRSYATVLEYMVEATSGIVDNIPGWSPQDLQLALDAGKGETILRHDT